MSYHYHPTPKTRPPKPYDKVFDDFEDLMILHSAIRCKCDVFVTNDKKLLNLKDYDGMKFISPE